MLKSNWTPWWMVLLSERAALTPKPAERVTKFSNPQRALLNKKATSHLLLTLALRLMFCSGKTFSTTASICLTLLLLILQTPFLLIKILLQDRLWWFDPIFQRSWRSKYPTMILCRWCWGCCFWIRRFKVWGKFRACYWKHDPKECCSFGRPCCPNRQLIKGRILIACRKRVICCTRRKCERLKQCSLWVCYPSCILDEWGQRRLWLRI